VTTPPDTQEQQTPRIARSVLREIIGHRRSFARYVESVRLVPVGAANLGGLDALDRALRERLSLGPEPTVVEVYDEEEPQESLSVKLTEDDLLLLRLGEEAGGRIDPARILARKPESQSRRSFMALLDAGYVDGDGWITDAGREATRA
jgi:hypothetical protein